MRLHHAEYGVAPGRATPGIAFTHDLPVLREPRAPRRRVARGRHQGRHPPPARMPGAAGVASPPTSAARRCRSSWSRRSGERQPFDRAKLLDGLQRACHKRQVSTASLEMAVRDIEGELRNRLRQEVRSAQIGELALRRLKEIDPVAYVRFASVYRAFADVDEFEDELARLEREPPLPRGQFPLDDQLFQTLDAGPIPSPVALPSGHCPEVARGTAGAPQPPRRQPMATDAPPTMTDRVLGIPRRFTRPDVHPYDEIAWGPRDARIVEPARDGQPGARRLRPARLRVPARLVGHGRAHRRLQVLPLRHGRPAPRGQPAPGDRPRRRHHPPPRRGGRLLRRRRRGRDLRPGAAPHPRDPEGGLQLARVVQLRRRRRACASYDDDRILDVDDPPIGADEPQVNQASACFILSVNDTMPSIQRWIASESEIFRGGSGRRGQPLAPARRRRAAVQRRPGLRAGQLHALGRLRRRLDQVRRRHPPRGQDGDPRRRPPGHPGVRALQGPRGGEGLRPGRDGLRPRPERRRLALDPVPERQQLGAPDGRLLPPRRGRRAVADAHGRLGRGARRAARRASCCARSPRPRGPAATRASSTRTPSSAGTPAPTPAASRAPTRAASTCTSTTRPATSPRST